MSILRKEIVLFLLIFFVVSCEENECISDFNNSSISNTKRNLDDVLDIVTKSMVLIEKQGSRSVNRTFDVKNIKYICGFSSRMSDVDTTMYIVNFDDNQGYAIVSANKNTEGLIAITSKGNLNPSELDKNIGLELYLKDVDSYIRGARDLPPIIIDNHQMHRQQTDTIEKRVVEPRLTTKWGQDWPYDLYCNGYATGCSICAGAQIFAYFEYPTTMHLTFPGAQKTIECFDWSDIKQHDKSNYIYCSCQGNVENRHQAIANLFRQFGHLAGTQYDSIGGHTYDNNMFRVLNNFGYDVERVDDPLMMGNGLMIIHANMSDERGHIWLADGYYYYITIDKEYVSSDHGLTWQCTLESGPRVTSYIHYNWGVDGYDDGYFLAESRSVRPGDCIYLDDNSLYHNFSYTFNTNFKFYAVKR